MEPQDLPDRIYHASDSYEIFTGKKCGLISVLIMKKIYICVKLVVIALILIEFKFHML